MLDMQSRLEGEVADLRRQRDSYREEMQEVLERLRNLDTLLNTPLKDEAEDVAAFGRGAWVYCNQHMRPHLTGWCSVSPRDKVGLGVKTAEEAYDKCRAWGFPLYADRNKDK